MSHIIATPGIHGQEPCEFCVLDTAFERRAFLETPDIPRAQQYRCPIGGTVVINLNASMLMAARTAELEFCRTHQQSRPCKKCGENGKLVSMARREARV